MVLSDLPLPLSKTCTACLCHVPVNEINTYPMKKSDLTLLLRLQINGEYYRH